MKILTFDIEDWFHLLDHDETRSIDRWPAFGSRIEENVERILGVINDANVNATFFCLGWIAEKYPHVIKKIGDLGYEIGCHSYAHQLAYTQTPKQFRDDLRRAKSTIEDVLGRAIDAYRIPGFSLTKKNLWALDVIYEEGFSVDCSVFPASRAHGGMRGFASDRPCLIDLGSSGVIREFPLNTFPFFGARVVFSGGGYFRLLPYPVLARLFQKSEYVMTYFHPRDFDSSQPVIPGLSVARQFKSYYGLRSAERKLSRLLSEFDFVDLRTAVKDVDWSGVKVISFPNR